MATVLKDKFRILVEVKKASPLLSTVIQKCDGHTAEMENILVVWVHDQNSVMRALKPMGHSGQGFKFL
jgi:hypothetical protein